MSQPNIPQAPQRLPNEPYYQQPPPQPQSDQRRRWGRMLLIVGLVWLALTFVGSGPWLGGFPFAPSRTISQNITGSRLTITTQSDDVALVPSGDGQFHIRVDAHGFGWNGSNEDLLRRAGVQIRAQGDEVQVTSGGRGFQLGSLGVALHIEVPKGAPATINTSSGDISVENMEGAIAISTSSGDVQLNDLQGELTVATSSGDVRLRDGRVSGATIKTGSGDVDLSGVSNATKIATDSGDITLRDASDATLDLQSSSGSIDFTGVLASEGTNLIKTTSGDLNLRVGNSPLDISHTTNSGDVNIQVETKPGATPQLQLTTNSGGIEVKPLD